MHSNYNPYANLPSLSPYPIQRQSPMYEISNLLSPLGHNQLMPLPYSCPSLRDSIISTDDEILLWDTLRKINEDGSSTCIRFKRRPRIKKLPTRRVCREHGCSRVDRGRGLCGAHGGGKRCWEKQCEKPARKGGLCATHYRRQHLSSLFVPKKEDPANQF